MLAKAFLMKRDNHSIKIPFLFNPKDLTIEKSNLSSQRTLTLDLFFDTSEEKTDIRKYTERITDLTSDIHSPSIYLFKWGNFIFPCKIESAEKRFTMFTPEGIPVRATIKITLTEIKDLV